MNKTELELKLSCTKADLERIRGKPVFRTLATERAKRRRLVSTYYDTLDHRLLETGAALRVRRAGRRFVQTVKLDTTLEHGVLKATEVEQSIGSDRPRLDAISDPDVQKRLANAISGRELRQVFQTDVWRTSRRIQTPERGLIEVAFDTGSIHAGERVAEIHEIELELIEGPSHALLTGAERVLKGERFQVSRRNKAERGYAIIAGDDAPHTVSPKSFDQPVLTPAMSAVAALLATGKAAADQILHNWDVVLSSNDPEGPHQLRIGLRRLRTALRVFKPVLPRPERQRLGQAARDLARIVARLRDADVLLEDICRPAWQDPYDPGDHQELHCLLVTRREHERAVVRQALDGADWSELKLNCILFEQYVTRARESASADGKPDNLKTIARKSLTAAWRRARKWGRQIDALTIPERHEMRKELKGLRYATEFFAPLFAKNDVGPFLKDLKKLQDVFGYLNDVAMTDRLEEIVRQGAPGREDLVAQAQHVHDLHSKRAQKAWKSARKRWNALNGRSRFWK